MCGIAGALSTSRLDESWVTAMTAALQHRGPDAGGEWCNESGLVAFGHRRLEVVGLGPSGAQPCSSPSGRFVITYNGEIYNHLDLRRDVQRNGQAPAWRGASDTETLAACIDSWGIAGTVQRLQGMFAFAAWDRESERLTLVRDRAGEKPLYYGVHDGTCVFASELRALRHLPGFDTSVAPEALDGLLRHGFISAPMTIHPSVRSLPAASLVEIDDPAAALSAPVTSYWSAVDVARNAAEDPWTGSDDDAVAALVDLLGDVVESQMLADVPIGAFLSGGVDSSLIVALMQQSSPRPVRTFTIGFGSPDHDERASARAVAEHLGTDHTAFEVTDGEALRAIPQLPGVHDEPFADPSQIPTLLLSQLTRSQVTVALSGDAGDELFGGYDRYKVAAMAGRLPRMVRRTAGILLDITPEGVLHGAAGPLRAWQQRGERAPGRHKWDLTGSRLKDVARLLRPADEFDRYRSLLTLTSPLSMLRPDVADDLTGRLWRQLWDATDGLDPLRRQMAFDTVTYLPGDILTKVDRAAMSVALETRIPLLDHRIIKFAARLPVAMLRRDGRNKWPLQAALSRFVPPVLTDRPKAGFGVPLAHWLREPLRSWVDELLADANIGDDGLLDVARVRSAWAQHRDGRRDLARQLWPVIVYLQWRSNLASSRVSSTGMP